jgi:AcrR family transcriptional regulator
MDFQLRGKREGGTKRKIIETAIMLFSEKSYNNVSTRDIANVVGIRPASLYSHFESKDDILDHIYKLYEEKIKNVLPDVNNLLSLARTTHPHELLKRAQYFFDPADQEMMDRIILIASYESRLDDRSAAFIERNLIGTTGLITRTLLKRLLELGRIEPLDIDAFVTIITNLCYSTAIRNFSKNPVGFYEWIRANDFLNELIRPTGA